MGYVVVEIQKAQDGTLSLLSTAFNDPEKSDKQNRNEAESQYHDVLHYAAVSDLPLHSATLLHDSGREIEHRSYDNQSQEV